MEVTRVKIVKEGNRQTVELPESIHLAEADVYAVQIGTSVMLYSKPKSWEEWWKNLELFSDDFMADGRHQPTEYDKRESFD
jgi:antitoxin VapB